jgi:hypothetical protein
MAAERKFRFIGIGLLVLGLSMIRIPVKNGYFRTVEITSDRLGVGHTHSNGRAVAWANCKCKFWGDEYWLEIRWR